MKKIIQINLLLLITFLTACSSTRLIYTLAGEFIQDEITYFFNLDEEEEIFLDQQVKEMIIWHRKFMLPNYAGYLNDLADKLVTGQYKSVDINNALIRGRSLIDETVNGLTPRASKFLIRHQSFDSIKFMEKKMDIRRKERLEKISKSEDVLYVDRVNRLMSNFERFFGPLNDKQIVMLEEHSRVTLDDFRIRLHNRTKRQEAFVEFLRTKPTEEELTFFLNKLLLQGYEITNPTYKYFSEASLERFQKLLVNILTISSTVQREKIISKIRGYAKDFISISG